MTTDQPTSNELASQRTDMAAMRSMMAADRSLMAWIRTGLSMISFGFTIYKLLEGYIASGATAASVHSPRPVGMFLTGLGTVAILIGTVEYWHRLQQLRVYQQFKTWRPSFAMAIPCRSPACSSSSGSSPRCSDDAAAHERGGTSAPSGQWPPPLDASVIFSITWSRLKLAAFWRGGKSLKVARNSPTKAWAGTSR